MLLEVCGAPCDESAGGTRPMPAPRSRRKFGGDRVAAIVDLERGGMEGAWCPGLLGAALGRPRRPAGLLWRPPKTRIVSAKSPLGFRRPSITMPEGFHRNIWFASQGEACAWYYMIVGDSRLTNRWKQCTCMQSSRAPGSRAAVSILSAGAFYADADAEAE